MNIENLMEKEKIESKLNTLFSKALSFNDTEKAFTWFNAKTKELNLDSLPLHEAFTIEKQIIALHEEINSTWGA
jgi:hypothetical protein